MTLADMLADLPGSERTVAGLLRVQAWGYGSSRLDVLRLLADYFDGSTDRPFDEWLAERERTDAELLGRAWVGIDGAAIEAFQHLLDTGMIVPGPNLRGES